jgi:signal transduction histidine kinase
MKAVTLNEHAGRDAEKTGRRLNGKRSLTTEVGVTDRMERLLFAAQEMGGPLNVVIGRMEYLLERGPDQETVCSLNAIMPQAQRLVELRQQLIDEASAALTDADIDSPASTREAELPDA